MDLKNLPVIDHKEALKLAGNDENLAKDMRAMLIKNINDEMPAIKASFAAQNYIELYKTIHKLHGGACYCGVPRVKAILKEIELQIQKNELAALSHLLNQLVDELRLLQQS